MFRKWAHQFVEGSVYEISFLIVLPAKGSFRATKHAYRLLFSGKTKVIESDCNLIPMSGLSLRSSEDLNCPEIQTDFLVGKLTT